MKREIFRLLIALADHKNLPKTADSIIKLYDCDAAKSDLINNTLSSFLKAWEECEYWVSYNVLSEYTEKIYNIISWKNNI